MGGVGCGGGVLEHTLEATAIGKRLEKKTKFETDWNFYSLCH